MKDENAIFNEWRGLIPSSYLSDDKLRSYSALIADESQDSSISILDLRRLAQKHIDTICNANTKCLVRGDVRCKVEYRDGSENYIDLAATNRFVASGGQNTVLKSGKSALAKCLANDVNDPFDSYIDAMVFGTNGTSGGSPRYVDSARTGLFGTTLLTKRVISSIDDAAPTTVILIAVMSYDEGNGQALNEMGLKMKSGDLYSIITFPDLNKTSSMQLTFEWTISFL